MKPIRFYLWLMAPLAAWVLGDALLSTWRAGLDLERMPTAMERLLLAAGLWSVRALPFGIVAGVLAAPLLTLLAAWLVRRTRTDSPLTLEAIPWLGVWLASWIGVLLLVWSGRMASASMLLFWSGSLGQALAVALAYRVQQTLRHEGVSRVPGAAVLSVGLAAQLLARWAWLVVLVIPGWAEWRAGRGRRPTRG